MVKVVVIDDSAFMRKSLKLMLESDPGIQVIGTARDGNEGIEKIISLKPDIVTLDIEMPGMDGLTALKIIMEQVPVPVLMVSSLTTESAQATLQAFDLGAIDFISKDLSYSSINIINIKNELIEKVKQIAQSSLVRTRFRMRRLVQSTQNKAANIKKPVQKKISYESVMNKFSAVVVGVSTGGPQALLNIIPKLPESFPLGVAIVQHMPPHFTRTLAERLNSLSKVQVKEAEHGELFETKKILIAPGGKQMSFNNNGLKVAVEISEGSPDNIYRPSADLMMLSAASTFAGPLLGIIMTGMGKDGIEGLRQIKSKGGYVIGQSEESCVVYGMPRAAYEEGLVDSMQSLEIIVSTLERLSNTWKKTPIPIGKGEVQ
ncbi:MAG: chemotaxis response regulator protein-glutamate methylesterase [Bacteroidetes bacterium]|nr:chemotaxis response regulator protein-glutamate methylesterase [Bacteroidota bacterium]